MFPCRTVTGNRPALRDLGRLALSACIEVKWDSTKGGDPVLSVAVPTPGNGTSLASEFFCQE